MWLIIDAPADGTHGLLVDGEEARRMPLADETPDGLEGIAHILPHGGEAVRSPARRVDAALLREIGAAEGFLPEDSRRVIGRAARMAERHPDVPHVLLCDTAFFADLPEEARLYAVPYRLGKQGIRRYGLDGLIHEWVWRRAAELLPGRVSRLVSLRLGNHSNVASIRDGRAVDTSVGFTAMEGLPSDSASGDVDPNLVFQLHARGYDLREILDLLSRRSGFGGYVGRPTSFPDLLRCADPACGELRAMFRYAAVRYLGASITAMDGADALAVSAEGGGEALDMAVEICASLRFMGVRVEPAMISDREEPTLISRPDSSIPVVFFPTRRWKIYHGQARACP